MCKRCSWAGSDPVYISYHDEEWGVPLHDDQRLFEFLILEGAQAGLSWITVLRKRERYRQVLFGFDPKRLAQMTDAEIDEPVSRSYQLWLLREAKNRNPDLLLETLIDGLGVGVSIRLENHSRRTAGK